MEFLYLPLPPTPPAILVVCNTIISTINDVHMRLGPETLPPSLRDREAFPDPNHQFSSPDRCHLLIATILKDVNQRRALACEISGDDAQLMVDYLDMVCPQKGRLQSTISEASPIIGFS